MYKIYYMTYWSGTWWSSRPVEILEWKILYSREGWSSITWSSWLFNKIIWFWSFHRMATTTSCDGIMWLVMTSGCATVKDGQPPIFFKTNRTRGLYGLLARVDATLVVRPSRANLWNLTVLWTPYPLFTRKWLFFVYRIPIDNIYSE